jgi:hypothetical protein
MVVKTKTRKAVVIAAMIFTFIFCKANSCQRNLRCAEGSHRTIPIVNNSNVSINWTAEDSRDSVWTLNGQVPPVDYGLLAPGATVNLGASRDACWEESFAPGGYQYYFLFSHDTVVALGWNQISGTSRGLLKKIKVDLDYLKKNNFSIAFP